MGNLDAVYEDLWTGHGTRFEILDRSQHPRSWTFLFDIARETNLGPDSVIVDVGCGRGNHCFELNRQFTCRSIGIDVVFDPLKSAAAEIKPADMPRIQFIQASIDQLPLKKECADLVWCRDMLAHVRPLEESIRDCWRILRPGGKMLAWVTVETELMEPREAQRLYAPLGIESASLSSARLSQAFADAGFLLLRSEMVGSEVIEFYEERDGRASRELMRIARMARMRDQLVREWGQRRYDTVRALYHWVVYHLLGKLSSGYYLLEKPDLRR